MRRDGGRIIALAALIGLGVAIYNFFSPVGLLAPLSDTAGSPGAGLVIFGAFMLVVAGLVLGGRIENRYVIAFFTVGAFVGILGTGLAAYLLDSWPLLALMAVCLVGWLIRVLGGEPETV